MMENLADEDIKKMVQGMDRPELLKNLGLPFNVPLIKDIPEVKPISLYAKAQMKINSESLPFVNEGIAVECCSGALMMRWQDVTVVMPCYGTDIETDNAFCTHCAEMWAHTNDKEEYVLQPSMTNAWEHYRNGSRKLIKNWPRVMEMVVQFSDEVDSIKDAVTNSSCKLDKQWPGITYMEIVQQVLVNSGILFADT